jgi:hypothetical protein
MITIDTILIIYKLDDTKNDSNINILFFKNLHF